MSGNIAKFDFDTPVVRRGSGSYKWDSDPDPEVIPLWVADMDFRTAPCVIEALRRRVDHGVFGYTLVSDEYYDALTRWFDTRHGYRFTREQVIYTSGVVPAISAIIKALAKPGEGVIVQTPVYNCFFSSIRNNGCQVVEAPLLREDFADGSFTYRMDFAALERAAADPGNAVMLLCNPGNPAGRAWTADELRRVAEICERHDVRVISDEIHCELTIGENRYTPYGPIDPRAVVCLSPSKAFNTAGLQIANIICPDEATRAIIDKAINVNEVCDVNPFGVEGLKAAYSAEGAAWLETLKAYLTDNYHFTRDFLAERLPGLPLSRLEATYLPWLDVSSLGMSSGEMEEWLKEHSKVWVNCGEMYGAGGFLRLNIACPQATLAEGLRRLADGLTELSRHTERI